MSDPLTFASCELTQNQSIHRVHDGVVLFPVLCGMLSPPAARHHPVQCVLYSSQLLPLTRAHCTVHCKGKGHSLHSWLKWTSLACTVLWEDSLHGTDVQQWRLEWFKLIQGWQRWFLLPTSVWKCIVILPFSKAALPAFTKTTSPCKKRKQKCFHLFYNFKPSQCATETTFLTILKELCKHPTFQRQTRS